MCVTCISVEILSNISLDVTQLPTQLPTAICIIILVKVFLKM